MPFDFKSAVKKPWVKYTLIGVAGVGAVWILYSRVGGGSSSAAQSNAPTAAELQAQTQEDQITAQQNMQAVAASSQLALAKEQDSTSLTGQQNQLQNNLQLANITLQGLVAQIAGQTVQQQNQQNTMIALQNITANEQLGLAQTTAQTQLGLSQINAQTQQHLSDNQTSVAVNNSNNQNNSNTNNGLFGLISSIF